MKIVESYTFSNGGESRVLKDDDGTWFLYSRTENGLETVSQTDDEGAKRIIALAQDAKRRDAEEWPEIIE